MRHGAEPLLDPVSPNDQAAYVESVFKKAAELSEQIYWAPVLIACEAMITGNVMGIQDTRIARGWAADRFGEKIVIAYDAFIAPLVDLLGEEAVLNHITGKRRFLANLPEAQGLKMQAEEGI